MPASLFKSHPRSDRRVEWRNLKASQAKLLEAKKIKVEIGLGKELDNFQKQVDKVLAIEESKLTKESLASVVAAGQKVKKHVATLEPKVKGYDKLTKFLDAVEKDVAWWEKAAGKVQLEQRHVGGWESTAVPEATEYLLKAKPLIEKMDTLLSKAVKATPTYDPPREFEYWARDSKALRAGLTKLSVASKKGVKSHELVRELLMEMKEPVSDMRWNLSNIARLNIGELPALADWSEVKKTASDLANEVDEANRIVSGLK